MHSSSPQQDDSCDFHGLRETQRDCDNLEAHAGHVTPEASSSDSDYSGSCGAHSSNSQRDDSCDCHALEENATVEAAQVQSDSDCCFLRMGWLWACLTLKRTACGVFRCF